MFRSIKQTTKNYRKRKEDIGLSPFEIKRRTDNELEEPRISVINFSVEYTNETEIYSVKSLKEFTDNNQYCWVNIVGINDENLMRNLSGAYNIPGNIISDVLDASLRPQVEDYDDGLFASVKMMQLNDSTQELTRENICFIVTDNIIFSFMESPSDIFMPVKSRIQRRKSKIHASGTDYMFFALLDVIIDNYIYIIDTYGNRVEDLEEDLTLNNDRDTLRMINLLKQELNKYRRDIKPVKEMIFNLRKLETDIVSDINETHFKELQDNISQVSEMLDYYREVLYDALDVYHSSMSTRLNDIMAILTIFSVVFIPISFIAGLYGMNFVNMPELSSPYGYFIVLGVMFLIAAGMLLYFKVKKWF